MARTPRSPDRPKGPTTPAQDPGHQGSWFGGATGFDESTVAAEAQADDPPPSPRMSIGKERRPPTFFRIYRAFLTARAVLALLLIAITAGARLLGNRPSLWVLGLTLSYSILTLVVWWWHSQLPPKDPDQRTLRRRQALATIGIHLAAFAWPHFLTGIHLNSQFLPAPPRTNRI